MNVFRGIIDIAFIAHGDATKFVYVALQTLHPCGSDGAPTILNAERLCKLLGQVGFEIDRETTVLGPPRPVNARNPIPVWDQPEKLERLLKRGYRTRWSAVSPSGPVAPSRHALAHLRQPFK